VVVFHSDAVLHGVAPWRTFGMPLLDMLTALVSTGLDLPGGGRLGPLPATARRTVFLRDAGPWTPPAPKPRPVPEHVQRAALTAGTGLDTLLCLRATPPGDVGRRRISGRGQVVRLRVFRRSRGSRRDLSSSIWRIRSLRTSARA
jgi:hypothetical protein